MGEKTEQATPKKLRDARKKGQVAKSQDLPSAFTFIVSVVSVVALAPFMYKKLSVFLLDAFRMVTQGEGLNTTIPQMFSEAVNVIFIASMPILMIVTLIGVLITFLSVGPVFALEVFKFDIKKFNPVDNLKAKFKMKTLIELLKSVFKIAIAGWLIYGVMYNSIPVLIKTVSMPSLMGAMILFHAFLMQVVVKVGLFFIIVAVLDFLYQKMTFAKEMKMEKFEVKQEYKNSEGDPHIKGKRKQIAQEIAYQEGPAAGVQRAKALVTNPTHLAIALAYEKGLDQAPYITAMGQDAMAQTMITIAKRHNIPVMQNVPLAHELWEHGELYEYVPEETYEAIAEILRWVATLSESEETAMETNA